MGLRNFILSFCIWIAGPIVSVHATEVVDELLSEHSSVVEAIDQDQALVLQDWLNLNHSPTAKIKNKSHEGILERAATHASFACFEVLFRRAHQQNPTSALTDSRGTPLLVGLSSLAVPGKKHLEIYERMISLVLTLAPESAKLKDRAYVGDGRTALHQAASVGNVRILMQLMARGADVNAKNSIGETPLHLAAHFGHLEAVKYLMKSGALINERTKFTRATPLMSAAEMGHENIIRMLMISGAERDAKDAFGKTAPERFHEYVKLYAASAKRFKSNP